MRVTVDLKLCQGYANCVDAAPAVFDIADNGLAAVLVEEPGPELADSVREATRLCPVQAVVLESADEQE